MGEQVRLVDESDRGELAGARGDSDFAARFGEAVAHGEAGRWTEAATLYKQLLEEVPKHPGLNHNMGVAAIHLGVPRLGLGYLETALASDPQNAHTWIVYVEGLHLAGEDTRARSVLEVAINNGLAGEAAERLGHQLGIESCEVQQRDPQSKDGLTQESTSATEISRLWAPYRGAPSSSEIDALIRLFQSGDVGASLAKAEELTRSYPDDPFGWKALGAAMQCSGKSAAAVAPLRRAAVLAPHDAEAQYNLGVALQASGRSEDAECAYRRALEIDPGYVDAANNLGVLLHDQARLPEAERYLRQVVEAKPSDGAAVGNLAKVLLGQGRLDEAAGVWQFLVALAPGRTEPYVAWGDSLAAEGYLDDAEKIYRRAEEIDPANAEVINSLGVTLKRLSRLNEAEACFRRVVALIPASSQANNNLAVVLRARGAVDEAETILRQFLARMPESVESLTNLGILLAASGRLGEAETCFRKAIALDPNHAAASGGLILLLVDTGRSAEGIELARSLLIDRSQSSESMADLCPLFVELGLKNEIPDALVNSVRAKFLRQRAFIDLGDLELRFGRMDQAVDAYQSWVDTVNAMPDVEATGSYAHRILVHALLRLGTAEFEAGKLVSAEKTLLKLVSISPSTIEAYLTLGNVMGQRRRWDDAIRYYRKAIEIQPSFSAAFSNLLFGLSQDESVDPKAVIAEHKRFGDVVESPFRPFPQDHSNSRDPDRPLRIGWVSADFRQHTVAFFISPILRKLAKDPKISLHGFHVYESEDEMTRKLKVHFDGWHSVASLDDEGMARLVRNLSIDILIDLSGHSGKNRLPCFARKPAPIQASWLGYPMTTGMKSIDYYIGDATFAPIGEFDDQFTEAIVNLPASTTFGPAELSPDLNPLPALEAGHFTFGSFNHPRKIGRKVVALWARLLRDVPTSRMLLGGFSPHGDEDAIVGWFAEEGIGYERLEMYKRSGLEDYLRLHGKVDLCLDTFPYTGGTTPLHALWMGVPTLTIAGPIAASRGGVFPMRHVGLEEFIVRDAEEFVARGLYWTTNLDALSAVRSSLRQRFLDSHLAQPGLVAAGFGAAVRMMWRRWCAGLPPEPLVVSVDDAKSYMENSF